MVGSGNGAVGRARGVGHAPGGAPGVRRARRRARAGSERRPGATAGPGKPERISVHFMTLALLRWAGGNDGDDIRPPEKEKIPSSGGSVFRRVGFTRLWFQRVCFTRIPGLLRGNQRGVFVLTHAGDIFGPPGPGGQRSRWKVGTTFPAVPLRWIPKHDAGGDQDGDRRMRFVLKQPWGWCRSG